MKSQYTGLLDEPIPRDASEAEYKKLFAKKLVLLFERHGVDATDPQIWQQLAIKLAFAHVRGFSRAGKRAKKKWDLPRQLALYYAVHPRVTLRGMSEKEACEEILKLTPFSQWRFGEQNKQPKAETLRRQYNTCKEWLPNLLTFLVKTAGPEQGARFLSDLATELRPHLGDAHIAGDKC